MITQLYGLTTPDDVGPVVAAGADHIGVVLDEGFDTWDSVDADTALAILAAIPRTVKRVALSLHTEPDGIEATVRRLEPDIVHVVRVAERMAPGDIAALRRRLSLPLMCTIPVRDDTAVDLAREVAPHADFLLLDTADPSTGVVGATGATHDWATSAALVRAVGVPVILAGGLGPANVADAIRAVRPAGVDSETRTSRDDDRRRKDPDKVAAFVAAARAAAAATR